MSVSDPLRGCRCFRGGGCCVLCHDAPLFQTPCGDVGVSGADELRMGAYVAGFRPLAGMSVFPGDGLAADDPRHHLGFRPLAGMSVFPGHMTWEQDEMNVVSDPLRGCRCFRVNHLADMALVVDARFRPLAGMSVFPGH